MFFDGQILYRRRTERGEQYKFLSPAAVAEAFRQAPFDTGHLPPGVFRCGQSARGDFAALVIPAQRHELSVESARRGGGRAVLSLWLPAFVFFGIAQSYHVWAVKSDVTTPDLVLHHAPLPNVFNNGGICWGQNDRPAASTQTITEAWKLFIGSPFNEHAASNKVRGVAGDVRPYLRNVSRSKRRFPLGDLLPMRMHGRSTLDPAITELIQEGGQ
jgi:PRTRC genetic system protein B